MQEIKAKISLETALKNIEEIKENLYGKNILDLLQNDDTKKEVEKVKPGNFLKAAVVGGLVYYDTEQKSLVQKLINPIESGEQKCDTLYYKNRLTLEILRDEDTSNDIAHAINLVTRLTGRSKQIIGKIYGQDLSIMQDICAFFYVS